jgi:uncharacterized protein YvpB
LKFSARVSFFILLFFFFFLEDSKALGKTINAPLIQQMPQLPRGCEVTSLAMLLNSHGIQADKMTLAKQVKKVPFMSNGYRGNPHDGFVGDIFTFSNHGLGVYHGPIFQLANTYAPGRVVDFTGSSPAQIYQMIDLGSPVWVITNSAFKSLDSSYFNVWQTQSGPISITYKEHSVIVTGYDQNYVYVNDPLYNKPNRKVARKDFEASWIQMGRQAIGIIPKKKWDRPEEQTGRLVTLKAVNSWGKSGGKLVQKSVVQPFQELKVCGFSEDFGGQYQLCDGRFISKIPGYVFYETSGNSGVSTVATAENYLKQAKSFAGSLKWEINFEYRLTKYPTQPLGYPGMNFFNKTKEYMMKAETAIGKVKDPMLKAQLQQQLDSEVVVHFKRAQAYIDAISAGKKLATLSGGLEVSLAKNPLSDEGVKLYHQLSSEYNKNATAVSQVFGKSTRDAIQKAYQAPVGLVMEKHRNTITAKMLIDEYRAGEMDSSLDSSGARVDPLEYIKEVIERIADVKTREVYMVEWGKLN